jgi:dimethylhistidine N-methyltransferase
MNLPYAPAATADAKPRPVAKPGSVCASDRKDSRIVVQTEPNAIRDSIELKRGLLADDAAIDPKYFYDPAGCALFDAICRLPEYYLPRTEAAILRRYRREILAMLPPACQWIDLGCGSGEKSLAWLQAAHVRRYVGVDIADAWLRLAVEAIAVQFPDIEAAGVVTDFSGELAIQEVIAERPELKPVFFYPGSSLGNFTRDGALNLLQSIRAHLADGGALLIGVDLIKDARILEAAYDDTAGVTAEFNRNILRVVNERLDADFVPERFAHVARFNREERRIEMLLRSKLSQTVNIGGAGRVFREGECILTEYSHKYTTRGFAKLLEAAGFKRRSLWTDPAGWFGVFLAEA